MNQSPETLLLDSPFESYDGRRESAKSLLGFSLVYLTGYFTDPPATFHPELIQSLESDAERRLLVIGFRGSGKSTFGSLALPLWAALEHPEKYPFIILVADSSRQATLNISAIKYGYMGGMSYEHGKGIDLKYGNGTADFLAKIAGKSEPFPEDDLNLIKDATRKGYPVYLQIYRELRPTHFPVGSR
jgi:hypothetical protein